MSRSKSLIVSPQPATSILRRSARLISLKSRDFQENPRKDLVLGLEVPKKSRRILGPEVAKRLAYSFGGSIEGSSSMKSPESNNSVDGFSSLRRSLRVSNRGILDSNKEKPSQSSYTKSASTSSTRSRSIIDSSSCTLRRSPRFSSGGGSVNQPSSSVIKSGNSVLSKCSKKSISSEKGKGINGVRSRDRRIIRAKPKQMFISCDDEEEEEVNACLSEGKMMRITEEIEDEKSLPKADEGKKNNNKLEKGWTEELELALQGAYLTVKPSPNFWKKVSKMVPGKSAQECFDKVNSDLITPRQPQPRSRARKTNLSPIPQFSLSASKLLKPNSPKTKKIRHRRNNLSKKTIRHLLEKQNHMEQGHRFDLFSVFEPSNTSNLISTPTEKGKRLPKILESPIPCSRFASKDHTTTTLVSPPVLKQVKNKALHEKYIDHLHIREAKRKTESRKENIRPIDNQKKNPVRAAKDTLLFDVQDAMQKLKSLETENSSSSSDFCYDIGETDEEDEI